MGRHLTKSDYKIMPWKNGLGTTTELAVASHQDDRQGSPFLWRISVAGVTENGPFSHFQNIDRHIMVLTGSGLILNAGDNGSFVLDTPLKVTKFAGDWDVTGTLIDGPITDLNVMVDRRFANADVKVLEVSGDTIAIDLKASVNVFHVPGTVGAVSILANQQETKLLSGESYLFADDQKRLTLRGPSAQTSPANVIQISIFLH